MLQQHSQSNLIGIFNSSNKFRQVFSQCVLQRQTLVIDQFGGRSGDIEFAETGNLEQGLRIGGHLIRPVLPASAIQSWSFPRLVDIDDDTIHPTINCIIDLPLHRIW